MLHPYVHQRIVASNRTRSHDTAEVLERDGTLVIALADGAGGMRGGAVASQAFADAVGARVRDREFPIEDTYAWADLFRATDEALASNLAGETTGVVVVLGARRIVGVSTGDSEAWIVGAKSVEDLTVGQHTRRRLGSGHVAPTAFERHALDGVLLVASDGLFQHAARKVIAGIVRERPLATAAKHLVDLVRLPSGRLADDVAVVLAQPVGLHP